MTVNLAFSHSILNLFRVSASIRESLAPHTAIAIFEDEGAFLELVAATSISPEDHAAIVHSIGVAATSRFSPLCCVEVELSTDDIRIIRLRSLLTLSA